MSYFKVSYLGKMMGALHTQYTKTKSVLGVNTQILKLSGYSSSIKINLDAAIKCEMNTFYDINDIVSRQEGSEKFTNQISDMIMSLIDAEQEYNECDKNEIVDKTKFL